MLKIIRRFLILLFFECLYISQVYNEAIPVSSFSERFFIIGIFAFLLALSFFFGVERRLNLYQLSGKSDGVKEALNASLIEKFSHNASDMMLDSPLAFAFLALSLLNFIAYFIVL